MSRKRYLMQRGNVWHYNRAYPLDLQSKLGKAPFRVSLKTDSLAEAIRAKPEAERQFFAKVDAARATSHRQRKDPLPETLAQSIALDWFRQSLAQMDDWLELEQRSPARLARALEQADDHLALERRELVEEAGGAYARKLASEAATEAGFAEPGQYLPRLIQRARIALSEVSLGRLVADYGVRPGDPLFASAMETPQVPAEVLGAGRGGPTLNDLFEAFKAARWEDLRPSSRASFLRVFAILGDILGGRRLLAKIDRAQARRAFEIVKALPAGYGKGKRWEGLDTRAAVAKAERERLPRLSPKSINGTYMGLASTLMGWAVREGWIETNPFEGLRVKDRVAARDKRDPFTAEQLAILFRSSPWSPRDTSPGGQPIRYWLPLFALWQGMRRGEIAQLRVADFRREDGVDLFEVRGELKNVNARRTLPLHPELARLGVLEVVKQRRQAGKTMLFDGAKDKRGRWGDPAGKWFSALVKRHELEGKRLGLHSLRHNFEDALRRAGLQGTAIGAALAGRRDGDPVAAGYGRGFAPKQLAEAIAKVTYPPLPKQAARE